MKLTRHEQMLFALLRHAINAKEIPAKLFNGCGSGDWEQLPG